MMFWLEDDAEVLALASSWRLARDDERRLSLRRSSGSFFIFKESFLTVPGDLSLSITLLDTPPFFWEAGLESEAGWSTEGKRTSVDFSSFKFKEGSEHEPHLCFRP